MNQSGLKKGKETMEIVVFLLGEGIYGIEVERVREIIEPVEVTKTPKRSDVVEGIINLRGEIIPVVNLAKALKLQTDSSQEREKFIVMEIGTEKVALRVQDVENIQRVPRRDGESDNDFNGAGGDVVSSIIKTKEQIIVILNYDEVIKNIV